MLNDRLNGLSDYPFQRLAALLGGVGAASPAGGEPIVVSIGEPQHEPPALLARELAKAQGLWGKYPPINGTPEFRQAVAQWLTRRYRLPPGMIEPDRHILPVAGTREALFLAAALSIPETVRGQRPAVLLPNPFYQVYVGAAVMAGAEPVFVPDAEGQPDFSSLPDSQLGRAALAFLCSPANPQGTVAGLSRLKDSIQLARRFGFTLALDECYAEIYGQTPPPGGLEACAALGGGLENVLVFHSLSKRSSVPGLRSGFAAGCPELIAAFQRLRSYGGATVPLPVIAASTALWQDETHVEANRKLYSAKFDLAEQHLKGRFGFARPEGGFFLWLDVGDGEAAAKRLWQEGGIRVLPGAYLARDGQDGVNPGRRFIRVALVHDLDTTARALSRMSEILGG
jgi:N-succinyldiaminopimelate aminotransferase